MTELTDAPAETDAHLLTRCQRGDGAAWEALVARYQRLLIYRRRSKNRRLSGNF